jgi:adenine deaminase
VINGDADILHKIEAAKHTSKPIDGHAPGLRGEALATYIAAGISTDHECFTKEEALEKLSLGMKILVREGSAAKNFDALIELLADYPQEMMFCTDDMHPDNLVKGHINLHCKRAVDRGVPVFNVLKAACFNPILHYQLNVGCLREKDPADFIIVKDVSEFEVLSTYINGECVAKNGKSFISRFSNPLINKFNCAEVSADSLKCDASSVLIDGKLPVIEAVDGQLVTNRLMIEPKVSKGFVESDTDSDVLKLVVINRYSPSPPAIAFIKNFGLKNGAIASSVAHDSHNIIATGVNDEQIADAINLIVKHKGGISATDGFNKSVLPLPVAGLMSVDDGYEVADAYTRIDQLAKGFGSQLSSPFMTLSFMALLVIPSLKLSDLGLFDGQNFRFVYR